MMFVRQIGTVSVSRTASVSNSYQPERPRSRPSQKHLKKHQPTPIHQVIKTEPRERDEAALIALRLSIARSLMELGEACGEPGPTPYFAVSGDGYRVYRIWIGGAEVLMAVKESERGTQVRYIYFDGSDGAPELWTGEFPDARAVTAKEKAAAGIG